MYNGFPRSMTRPRVSPSVSQQASLYGGQIDLRPRSLLGSIEPQWLPLIPNLEEEVPIATSDNAELINATNQFLTTGTPDTTKRPLAPVGSGAGNRPTNKAYNRFNETEKREESNC